MAGGVLSSCKIEDAAPGVLSFVQISDTHIGFGKDPNPHVADTLQSLVGKINALPERPPFVLHTGDLTHLSKPEEFDTLEQILKGSQDRSDILRAGRARHIFGSGCRIFEAVRQGNTRVRDGRASTITAHITSG